MNRYSISFTKMIWVKDHSGKVITIEGVLNPYKICDKLEVTFKDLTTCFRYWGENYYPQEYFYKTGEGIKRDGDPYDIGLQIWNYQGGGLRDKGEVYPWGSLSKVRSWGLVKHTGLHKYRELDYPRFHYCLGVLA